MHTRQRATNGAVGRHVALLSNGSRRAGRAGRTARRRRGVRSVVHARVRVCLRLAVPWCVRDVGHAHSADHTRIGGEIAAGRLRVAERQRTLRQRKTRRRITDSRYTPERERSRERAHQQCNGPTERAAEQT
jgi:hypothetical protein